MTPAAPERSQATERSPAVSDTLVSRFAATVAARADDPALSCRDSAGGYETQTWRDYAQHAAALAGGLRAHGIGKGDHVVLLVRNRPEFYFFDTACLLLGAIPVSAYNSPDVERLAFIFEHCEVAACLVEDDGFLGQARAAATASGRQPVFVCVEPVDDPRVVQLDALHAAEPVALAEAAADASPDDTAVLIYSSGTTGQPKGVVLTHRNLTFSVDALTERIGADVSHLRQISYLPMAHIGERLATHYFHLAHGTHVTCCPVMDSLGSHLLDVRPHFLFGAPRLWERLYLEIQAYLDAVPSRRAQFDVAFAAAGRAEDVTRAAARGVINDVLGAFGLGNLSVAIVGSAPLPPHVQAFWVGCRVPLGDFYGQTECCVGTWDPHNIVLGTCGRAHDGVDVKIAGDGEILLRSPGVFARYHKDPVRTAETVDVEGWCHTGDLGTLDRDGNLIVLGRKNDTIVPTSGHNVSPSRIEAALKRIPGVEHAYVFGHGRAHVGALLFVTPPDPTHPRDPQVEAAVLAGIETGIQEVNATLPGAERVRCHLVLHDVWLPDSEVLTPTGKMRRSAIAARYAALIDDLYRRS